MKERDIITLWREKAKKSKKRLIFPEGNDPRILETARRLKAEGLAEPILVDREVRGSQFETHDSQSSSHLMDFANLLFEKRKARGMTAEEAEKTVRKPLYFGCLAVANGLADGFVGGASNTTADTLRAALSCIGLNRESGGLSSCFIMVTSRREFGENGILVFADCAVNINPSARQLAAVGIASAESFRRFVGGEPRVAFLSFSTKGSAEDESISKVREALALAREKRPDILMDGEMQLDAALVMDVAKKKAPQSPVAGRANVLIFPELNSSNIGYKLVQRFTDCLAVGPILQGLAKPVNDLSRGATVEDIVNTAVITAIQAQGE